jgi:hypothetical protein
VIINRTTKKERAEKMKELEKLQKELSRSKMENLRCFIHDRFRVVTELYLENGEIFHICLSDKNHKHDPSETLVYNFSVQDLVNPDFDVSAHADKIGKEYLAAVLKPRGIEILDEDEVLDA